MRFNYYSTHDRIVLYWEPTDTKEYTYLIKVNNEEYEKTKKTHFTLESLIPESEYHIIIKKIMENVANPEIILDKIISTKPKKNKIDITKEPYMAKGDGNFLNTQIIQGALNNCGENDCIYIPKGTFLTGALTLHSNTEIYLEEGAILQGTDNPKDYLPMIKSRFEGIERLCYSALLNMGVLNHNSATNCENIIIHGKGTILGGGKELAKNVIAIEKTKKEVILEEQKNENYETNITVAGRARPKLINISNCKNVILSGLTIGNGPAWNVHMVYSENILTHNCTFVSKEIWNGDGWNPDSSKNCSIFGCVFDTGDDAIAIKSGKNPEGNHINRPCENIRIFDCKSLGGHGITIGSEMSGGVQNVKIWDCNMANSTYGFEIKGTKKRGGFVRNIQVFRCELGRLLIHSVGYNDDGEGAPTPPKFENCFFENIFIKGNNITFDEIPKKCASIELKGFDEDEYSVSNIVLKNIIVNLSEEDYQVIEIKNCKDVHIENITCK